MAGANKKTKQKRGLRIENSSMIVQRLYKSGTRRHCHASSLQADLIESDQDLERNSLSESTSDGEQGRSRSRSSAAGGEEEEHLPVVGRRRRGSGGRQHGHHGVVAFCRLSSSHRLRLPRAPAVAAASRRFSLRRLPGPRRRPETSCVVVVFSSNCCRRRSRFSARRGL